MFFCVRPWFLKTVCVCALPWFLKTVRVCVLPWWILPCFSVGISAAALQPSPPRLTAPVNDFAGVIDTEHSAELDRRIRALQTATGDVVVVATVPTFKPYGDINEYAVKMFENGGQGIGQRGKDNGALIVVAVEDHAIRIEVGYDLEQFITDGFAGETIRTVVGPWSGWSSGVGPFGGGGGGFGGGFGGFGGGGGGGGFGGFGGGRSGGGGASGSW